MLLVARVAVATCIARLLAYLQLNVVDLETFFGELPI